MAEKKYEKLKVDFKPVLVPVSEVSTLAVSVNATKRLSDDRQFADVQLISGFVGDLGGLVPNKYNGRLTLPLGLTKDHWQKIMEAYQVASEVCVKTRK